MKNRLSAIVCLAGLLEGCAFAGCDARSHSPGDESQLTPHKVAPPADSDVRIVVDGFPAATIGPAACRPQRLLTEFLRTPVKEQTLWRELEVQGHGGTRLRLMHLATQLPGWTPELSLSSGNARSNAGANARSNARSNDGANAGANARSNDGANTAKTSSKQRIRFVLRPPQRTNDSVPGFSADVFVVEDVSTILVQSKQTPTFFSTDRPKSPKTIEFRVDGNVFHVAADKVSTDVQNIQPLRLDEFINRFAGGELGHSPSSDGPSNGSKPAVKTPKTGSESDDPGIARRVIRASISTTAGDMIPIDPVHLNGESTPYYVSMSPDLRLHTGGAQYHPVLPIAPIQTITITTFVAP